MKLDWGDAREIGELLYERFPDLDPLSVRFTDLHAWILEVPDFAGEAKASSEKHLEAIQMIWLEEWKIDNED